MSVDVVAITASVTSALVSVIAVVIAARSAAAAERSANTAGATLRRTAVRELVNLCHDVIAEDLRIIELGPSLESEYTTLFVLGGSSGGSRETQLKAALEADMKASAEIAAEATTLGDDLNKLHSASDDDINQMSTHLVKARTRIRAIRESIELQLNEARATNREQRARR